MLYSINKIRTGVIVLKNKTEKINVIVDEDLIADLEFIQKKLSEKNLIDINKSNAVRSAIRYLADDLKK